MNLSENGADNYDWNADGVYQLEVTDRVQGGPGGISNRQATELVKRTRNLHGRVQTVEANKAPLASPALLGVPTAPTAPTATNSTQIANTAFVQAVVAALVASSPAALDTLKELATALGNDANFATTMTNALAAKAPLNSPGLTGTPTAPTASTETNNSQLATTAFVKAVVAALGYDPNFANTTADALATKLNRNFDNLSSVVGALTALNVEGSAVLSGTDIDWSGKPIRTKTLTGATTLTFSDLIINKTITLKVTGDFTLTLPTSVSMVSGAYDGTKINLIQLLCVDTATPEVWCVISQKQ